MPLILKIFKKLIMTEKIDKFVNELKNISLLEASLLIAKIK